MKRLIWHQHPRKVGGLAGDIFYLKSSHKVPVVYPGEGDRVPPLSKGMDDPPPPLSQGLYPALSTACSF